MPSSLPEKHSEETKGKMLTTVRLLQDTPAPAPPPPPPTPQDVEFSYNSQDTVVMPSQSTLVSGVLAGPSTDKTELNGGLTAAEDGRFVYPDHDSRSVAAISFAAVAKTIQQLELALGQKIEWPFPAAKLGINADAGEDFNAYYSRDEGAVSFFHAQDPITGAMVFSGGSGEVASHEAGHAILDGLRPGYFSSWATDVGAFHESFGDMVGMIMALQDERVLARTAVQTGGNLRKPNVAADLGESLGRGINDMVGENVLGGDYVRTAINSFKWQDPATLPWRGTPDQLGAEVHDFSRLWTGAFYDVLCAINNEAIAAGASPKEALRAAGQEGLKLLANLMKNAPQGEFTYREMAEAFVASDREHNNGARADLIEKVMKDREIIPTPAEPTPPPTEPTPPTPEPPPEEAKSIFTSTTDGRKPLADVVRTVTVKLSGPEFGMFNGAKVQTLVDKDGGLSKDAEVGIRTRKNVARLIKEGRIRYNDPGYTMKPEDYFDANGRPYTGVVRWVNGEMTIERVKIAT